MVQGNKTTDNTNRPIKYKHQEIFDQLLAEYKRAPTSRKLLDSMINFNQLYRKVEQLPPWFADPFGAKRNAQIKRAEIYNTSKDLIEATGGRYGKQLVVTSKGRKVYFEQYPLARLKEETWDGEWSVITYDLPSTKHFNKVRNTLRGKLKSTGFGALQRSVYVSPLPLAKPIHSYIEGEKLTDHVVVFSSQRVFGLEDQQIAKRAYNLRELENLYYELNMHLKVAQENKKSLKRWKLYYLAVNFADPQLPKELLPEDWEGQIAHENFLSTLSLLEKVF